LYEKVSILDKRRRLNDFAYRLTQPLVLEDGRPPKVLTSTLFTLSGFVIAAVLWASLTNVKEMTMASGQVVPRGQIVNVQHLEGGIVAEILVREGATVHSGQPLVRLDPIGTTSDRNQLESRKVALALQMVRLEAQDRGEIPDFKTAGQKYPQLVSEQLQLYTSSIQQRAKENATLAARLSQRRSDLLVVESDLKTAKLQVDVQREQFEIQSTLVIQGYTAKKTYLESKSLLQRAQGEVNSLEGKIQSALDAVNEAENARAESEANAKRKLAEERSKVASDLSEAEQQLAKLSDRVDRLFVRSPTDGYVLEMAPKSIGEVIRAGDVVARVVPSGQELVAEVRIESKDSGHIVVGAPANIKFTTYDSALYGTLQGTVEYLSASSFVPQPGQAPQLGQTPGEPYYKATIRLLGDSVGVGSLKHKVVPGMVLQAQIVTGSKSIVRYMLKPVFNTLDVAFSER
jgi:HlyD family secretion protein/adhesin transport system membrane fusion protein